MEKYFKAIEKKEADRPSPVKEINVDDDQINPPNKKRKMESEEQENPAKSPAAETTTVLETEKGTAAEEPKPVQVQIFLSYLFTSDVSG